MDRPGSNNEESSSPAGSGGGGGESSASGSAEQRWTCEACGCNTNSETDRSCTICGTSQNNGSSILRRAGYAARASGLFARSAVAVRRSGNNNEDHQLPFGGGIMMDGYYHDFFESVIDGDVDMGAAADDDDEQALAAMAVEASGLGSRGGSASARLRAAAAMRGVGVGPRSIVDAARSFSVPAREQVQRLTPEELLSAANENDSLYQPKWMNPSQIGGRMRTGNGIEVGEGTDQNVAYLPLGSGEGRALRALEAFPRSFPFASFSMSSSTSASSGSFSASGQERRPRRVFGFKVAFAHPSKKDGENMGGRYLIGVTTTSFSSFSEKNALQQSPFFYGIEDGGSKFEGTRNHSSSNSSRESIRGRRRSSFAIELKDDEAPRNEDGALFGSKEVITCVVDLESRTLTFWRDQDGEAKLLGTLVTNIPRSVQLYPVVVPYNAGSIVAITGMSGEPLPLLSSFATSWKQAQAEKDTLQRRQLMEDRSALVENGTFTTKLVSILQQIFSRYKSDGADGLTQIEASRLWYQCGLRLSSLNEILGDPRCVDGKKTISFEDFRRLLQRIIADDGKHYPIDLPEDKNEVMDFKIGEKVELVSNYERFGDASNGPLLPGSRGTVIELQGAQGLRHSIRVIYNSRRWWYQPQALVRERSGLVDSPGIWFLKGILRSHAYDEKTLESLVGKQVSTSSWKIGDMVAPKKLKNPIDTEEVRSHGVDEAIGRIVIEPSSSSPFPARVRSAGSVNVVFISKVFAESTYLQSGSSFQEKPDAFEIRKIAISRLVHTSAFHGLSASQKPRKGARIKARGVDDDNEAMDLDTMSCKLTSDFQRLKNLDVPAIERITKECDKTSTSLVGLVEAGLPKFVLQAMEHVMKNIQISENDESIAQAISALGKLVLRVTEKTFPDECCSTTADSENEIQKQKQGRTASEDLNSLNATSNENESPDASAEDQSDRTARSSSLMQRRRMLLSLMSRARRSGGDSLGDIISREMNGLPSLEMSADAAEAFFFAPPGAGSNFEDDSIRQDDGRLENSRPSESTASIEKKASTTCASEDTLIDSICRGRVNEYPAGVGSDGRCIIPLGSIKSIVSVGILGNSLPWLKAFLSSFAKKVNRKNSTSEFPILNHALDDDGMPLLQLAISFGCSRSVIEELIRYGAPVTGSELQLAVDINLPDILSVLLLHQVYSDGIVNLKGCSSAITEVVSCAQKRQEAQRQNLRRKADSFLASFTQKLVQIGLKRRQLQQQNGNDVLGRTIACALVGNIELCALRKKKKRVSSGEMRVDDDKVSGRSEINISGMDSCGILQILPLSIFGRSLSEEPSHLTNLLLLIEDFLCSKGINDGCVGLTLLLTLLQRFPPLSQSIEMERYGFAELVDSHAALSLNRLTEISSRIAKRNTCASESSETVFSAPEVIFCPKKHVATLHITKHSSFRCDLCGVGVKCGAIMHGCRECDWDACEACTDKVEGGILKWKFVKELSEKCQEILGQNTIEGADIPNEEHLRWVVRVEESLRQSDNSSDVNNLSIRLLQRDPDAIQGLANMLREKGRVTMHQFLMVILPALHSTLMGKSSSSEQSNPRRRSKKPRVAGVGSRENEGGIDAKEEERLEFAKEILKSLVNDYPLDTESIDRQEEDQPHHLMEDDDGDVVVNLDDSEEHGESKVLKNDEHAVSKRLPELLRRLHRVLALHEDVSTPDVSHYSNKNDVTPGNLRSLKELMKIRLRQQDSMGTKKTVSDKPTRDVTIFSEPLVSVHDLSHQILKTAATTHPEYALFCRKLVDESAIILERPTSSTEKSWRIAKIVSYDGKSGCHGVMYASSFAGGSSGSKEYFDLKYGDDFPPLEYEVNIAKLILSARKFVIIHRAKVSDKKSAFDMEQLLAEGMVGQTEKSLSKNQTNMIGAIVESDIKSSSWATYTVVGVDCSDKSEKYDILSEEGEVFCNVPANRISGVDSKSTGDSEARVGQNSESRQGIEAQGPFGRVYPFLMSSTRRQNEDGEGPNSSAQKKRGKKSLKRTWSALALSESMRPVEVSPTSKFEKRQSDKTSFNCSMGGRKNMTFKVDRKLIEFPPSFQIRFSSPQSLSSIKVASAEERTLVSLLHQLYQSENFNYFCDDGHQIFYSLHLESSANEERVSETIIQKKMKGFDSKVPRSSDVHGSCMDLELKPNDDLIHRKIWETGDHSLKLTHTANLFDYDEIGTRCSGLDEICVQCIELLEFLARVNTRFVIDKKENASIFVNEDLSQKLTKQTEDPLFIVGGIIPEWCLSIPALTPNIFSYTSRKALLDRVAFGVSRSTLRQQDAKVNIGRLRQRMTALRARAVELVGEAFSGGAEDPTALQLQADELYGMEEALATRVRSAFRSEGWEEMSLQVAKAAIHRESLLLDAMSIMDQYCGDSSLKRRRLEVRFDGESGFDAASGDEAGVTRGFYADIAEALMSCETVAGVNFSTACALGIELKSELTTMPFKNANEPLKLPLWIPDVDATGQVIIPTPRAAPSSIFGIFPRPMSKFNPQFSDVLKYFKFMGQLFAAAMRDGFMFPLPLSSSFLKLVQYSGENSLPQFDPAHGLRTGVGDMKQLGYVLSSDDLPRPGFLGGEVFAVEQHICHVLDQIDQENPYVSNADREREYKAVATDKNFARTALGKNYDCSFNEYFQDKTFVDPLDPTQGITAHPLCSNGCDRSVTIHNIREWVARAKYFMLHEGVIGQAAAFKAGIDEFFSSDYLGLFTSEELQRDVCGMGDNVDNWDEEAIKKLLKLDGKGATEALVAVAAIGGNAEALGRRFDPSSQTIKFVVRALLEASPKQRRQFLSFVTSVPIVTPGLIEIIPIVSSSGKFLPMRDPGCLPRANTCARRLYLPKFESYESFSQVLWAVVKAESKHKGFFEWNL